MNPAEDDDLRSQQAQELLVQAENFLDDVEEYRADGEDAKAKRAANRALAKSLEALRLYPTSSVYALCAQAAFAAGDAAQALKFVRTACRLDPTSNVPLTNAGVYALALNRPKLARTYLTKALEAPERDDVHITLLNLACTYEALGDLERAYDYAQRSLEECPEYQSAVVAIKRIQQNRANPSA